MSLSCFALGFILVLLCTVIALVLNKIMTSWFFYHSLSYTYLVSDTKGGKICSSPNGQGCGRRIAPGELVVGQERLTAARGMLVGFYRHWDCVPRSEKEEAFEGAPDIGGLLPENKPLLDEVNDVESRMDELSGLVCASRSSASPSPPPSPSPLPELKAVADVGSVLEGRFTSLDTPIPIVTLPELGPVEVPVADDSVIAPLEDSSYVFVPEHHASDGANAVRSTVNENVNPVPSKRRSVATMPAPSSFKENLVRLRKPRQNVNRDRGLGILNVDWKNDDILWRRAIARSKQIG